MRDPADTFAQPVGGDAIARTIAAHPTAATQGTVRAIWESLDKPYRAAVEQGLLYTRLGNPIGSAAVDRTAVQQPDPHLR